MTVTVTPRSDWVTCNGQTWTAGCTGNLAIIPERLRMAEDEDQLPESQIGRAQWLADELALCGHDDITAIDLLDALASVGLKLMPDMEGTSSHEYLGAHKSVIRSAKADLN